MMDHNSVSSIESNLYDEDRVRKLFQACDTDGDGFIDSCDLLTICRELNLEDSLEELMKELGADENGRISYTEFLRRRLALRPEIEAIRTSSRHGARESVTPDYLPTSSDNSLGELSGGKCGESWEFDSGARDLSPEPNTLQRLVEAAGHSLTATNTASLLELANKLHLAALASLKGEILELTTRLHAVTQERDVLEQQVAQTESAVAQQYEERLTELHSVIAELSRKVDRQKSLVITEEDDEPSETELSIDTCSQTEEIVEGEPPEIPLNHDVEEENKTSEAEKVLCELQAENNDLKQELAKSKANLYQTEALLACGQENTEILQNKVMEEQHSFRQPGSLAFSHKDSPVLKVAERVRLHKMDRHISGFDLAAVGVSRTEVAEQLVSELQDECNLQELSSRDHRELQLEVERLNVRLDHSRSQVSVLQSVLEESKSLCERLYLLLGKYESNVIASCLALTLSDRMIEAYDVLVSQLDAHAVTEGNPEEEEIRKLILDLKAEKNLVKSTVVELESFTEHTLIKPPSRSRARKPDLETAVLMQELMAMREDKTDLRAKVYLLERERENQELKIVTLQSQQQANLATIQHLQSRLQAVDLEGHPDGQENRLRERLREVTSTLEHVTLNAEYRQKQALELQTTNSSLVHNLERCKRKSQARLRRLDTQMVAMVERHAAQVRALKHRISNLEGSRERRNSQSQMSLTSETSL